MKSKLPSWLIANFYNLLSYTILVIPLVENLRNLIGDQLS